MKYLTYKEIERVTGKGSTTIQNFRRSIEKEGLTKFKGEDIFKREALPNGNFKVYMLEAFIMSHFNLTNDFASSKTPSKHQSNHPSPPINSLIQQLSEKDEQIKKLLEINLALTNQNTDLIEQLKEKESIQTIQEIKSSFTPIRTTVRNNEPTEEETEYLQKSQENDRRLQEAKEELDKDPGEVLKPLDEDDLNDWLEMKPIGEEIGSRESTIEKDEQHHKNEIMKRQQEGIKQAFKSSGLASLAQQVGSLEDAFKKMR